MDGNGGFDDVDSAAIEAIETLANGVIGEVQGVGATWTRPSVVYRAVLSKTPRAWKVTYGDFIAFGATPNIAMRNFDQAWYNRGLEPE